MNNKYDWGFQEWYINWSVWGIGVNTTDRSGWDLDHKKIYLGPIRIIYYSSKQMDKVYGEVSNLADLALTN